jgi:hypothetical protein
MVWVRPVMAQPKWLGLARPGPHLKKNPKKFQKSFKKFL